MRKLFRKSSRSILGIDIGSTYLKIVGLSHYCDKYHIDGYGCMRLPQDSMTADVIADCIKSLLLRAKLSSKHVIMAISDSCVIRKIISMPTSVHEIDRYEWILMEAAKHIPYPINEISLDFNLVSSLTFKSEIIDVLVVASRSINVDLRLEVARLAGLIVDAIDVETYAIERSWSLCESILTARESQKNIAIFDLGATYLRCVVLNTSKSVFSHDEAWIEPLLIELAPEFFYVISREIKRILQLFFMKMHAGIDSILLSGGIACLPGIEKVVQEHLNITTMIVNPFRHASVMQPLTGEIIPSNAAQLLVAFGLALRGLDVTYDYN